MTRRLRSPAVALLVLGALAAQPISASASPIAGEVDGDSLPVILDALVMRPVGFLTMCAGFVTFAAASPVMAITRPTDMHKPWKSLVVLPSRFTFVDPLGFHPDRRRAEAEGRVE